MWKVDDHGQDHDPLEQVVRYPPRLAERKRNQKKDGEPTGTHSIEERRQNGGARHHESIIAFRLVNVEKPLASFEVNASRHSVGIASADCKEDTRTGGRDPRSGYRDRPGTGRRPVTGVAPHIQPVPHRARRIIGHDVVASGAVGGQSDPQATIRAHAVSPYEAAI